MVTIANAFGWKIVALQTAGSGLISEDVGKSIAQVWGCPNPNKVQNAVDRILKGLQADTQPHHFSIVNPDNGEVYFYDVIRAD